MFKKYFQRPLFLKFYNYNTQEKKIKALNQFRALIKSVQQLNTKLIFYSHYNGLNLVVLIGYVIVAMTMAMLQSYDHFRPDNKTYTHPH